jgi:nitroreductase
MMKTIEAIHSRRSIKHFDASHEMTAEEANEILSLAVLSPTAFNIQNWRFVVVDDAELRRKIREVSWDQSQVTDASLFIVLCADLRAWEKEPARYWVNAPREVAEFMLPAIDAYYRGKEQVQRDEAMRSCGIAAQTLMLAAGSLGYDSCPMDGFDFEKVAQLIRLPDDHVIVMFVAIGKGTKEAWPRPGQLSLDDVVVKNVFEE